MISLELVWVSTLFGNERIDYLEYVFVYFFLPLSNALGFANARYTSGYRVDRNTVLGLRYGECTEWLCLATTFVSYSYLWAFFLYELFAFAFADP